MDQPSPRPVLDYHQPDTPPPRAVRTFGEKVGIAAIFGTFFCWSSWLFAGEPDIESFVLGWFIWLILAVVLIASRWGAPEPKRPEAEFSFRWKLFVWFLLVISIVVSVRMRSCPHGIQLTAGTLTIAWSDNGGPCRNGWNEHRQDARHLGGNWYFYYIGH